FGFAVEHGALTQSVDNNVLTFRGNIANLMKAINAKDYAESYRRYQDSTAMNLISKVSFSVSFVAGQNGSQNSNSQSTLSGYSFHIDLFNHRDPRDKRYIADWNTLVDHGLTDLATKVGRLHDLIDEHHHSELVGWKNRANTLLATVNSSSSDDDIRA